MATKDKLVTLEDLNELKKYNDSEVSDLKSDFSSIKDALPTTETLMTGTNHPNFGFNSQNKVVDSPSGSTRILTYRVEAGKSYHLTSEAFSTPSGVAGALFGDTDEIAIGLTGELVYQGSSTAVSVNENYTPVRSGYLWVLQNTSNSRGILSIYEKSVTAVASQEELSNLEASTANNLETINDKISGISSKFPVSMKPIDGTVYENMYIGNTLKIIASTNTYIEVISAVKGDEFQFKSASYSIAGGYPAIVLSSDEEPTVGEFAESAILMGESSNVSVDFSYTAEDDGFIYIVQHPTTSSRGVLTIYKKSADNIASLDTLESFLMPLKGKTIAIMGDSIMQYMSGGYGGANEQTFVENGNSHTYDDITITNGIPYYNGNVCTVVNEKQSYYDSQGWDRLKEVTGAAKILNCSIGGSGIKEGTISTAYPGYENGTHHTNSLPNLVKWLFRMCESNEQPDLAVIWMGTNLIGGDDGDIDTVFNTPWEDLSSDEGHVLRQTTIGALRYAVEKIYREMPHTYILVLGPIQADTARNPSRTFAALKSRTDAMKSVTDRISVKFIEPLTEIEIYGDVDTANNSRYLVDGLHCNEAGKDLLTAFLNKKIVTNYIPK